MSDMGTWELPAGPPTATPHHPTARPAPVRPTEILDSGVAPPPPFVASATPAGRPIGVTSPTGDAFGLVACISGAVVAAIVAIFFVQLASDNEYPPAYFGAFVCSVIALTCGARALQRVIQLRR